MALVHVQLHAYERDHPGRLWADMLAGPAEVTGDQMVAVMDDGGVDSALVVSPWTMYRFVGSGLLVTPGLGRHTYIHTHSTASSRGIPY